MEESVNDKLHSLFLENILSGLYALTTLRDCKDAAYCVYWLSSEFKSLISITFV